MPNYTVWNPQTFEFIEDYKAVFLQVAGASGLRVSPQLLAGAMAREISPYLSSPSNTQGEQAKDLWALTSGRDFGTGKLVLYESGFWDAQLVFTKFYGSLLIDNVREAKLQFFCKLFNWVGKWCEAPATLVKL